MEQFTLTNDRPKPVLWKGPPQTKPPVQTMFLSGLDLDPGTQELFDTEGLPQENDQIRNLKS